MIRAFFADGSDAIVDSRYGETADDLIASLTADGLTGSAVPLADVKITLADGREIPYDEINAFVTENA